jgi:hypothetical protein
MKVNINTNNDIYNMNGYSLSVSYIESISDIFMKKLSNVKFIILAIFIVQKTSSFFKPLWGIINVNERVEDDNVTDRRNTIRRQGTP